MNKTTWANLPEKMHDLILPGLGNTAAMVAISMVFALAFGLMLAVFMIVFEKRELSRNSFVSVGLDVLVNLVMAFPFIILAVYLIPFTKMLLGSSLGIRGGIVPMVIVGTAYIAKLFRDGLKEVNPLVIQAALSFGATTPQAIRMMLKEAMPSFVAAATLLTISMIDYSTMAGSMGAGGIGSVAVVYGYHKNDFMLVVPVAIILIVIVQIIQRVGDVLYKKVK